MNDIMPSHKVSEHFRGSIPYASGSIRAEREPPAGTPPRPKTSHGAARAGAGSGSPASPHSQYPPPRASQQWLHTKFGEASAGGRGDCPMSALGLSLLRGAARALGVGVPGAGAGGAGAARGLAIRYNRKKGKQKAAAAAAAAAAKEPRVGRAIKAAEVRLVGDGGHEVLKLRAALAKAAEAGLDLVEVNPKASPPVCRVMDHRREQYAKMKREKERQRERGKVQGERKEVRMRATIAEGDYDMKVEQMERFLERGSRVRLRIFKGRPEEMEELAARVQGRLEEAARVESDLRVESGYGNMIFVPRPAGPAA